VRENVGNSVIWEFGDLRVWEFENLGIWEFEDLVTGTLVDIAHSLSCG
jgi:hypothetical protein